MARIATLAAGCSVKPERIYIEQRSDLKFQIVADWGSFETVEAGPFENHAIASCAEILVSREIEKRWQAHLLLENAA